MRLAGSLVALATTSLFAGAASAAPVDWTEAFALQGRADLDPAVLVGFDPQPEPPSAPARAELDLRDPSAPILVLRDQSNPSGALQLFDLFFALDAGGRSITIIPCVLPSGASPRLELDVRADSVTGPLLFTALFDFATSSGGLVDPGSVVGFDPQPDPPGEFGATFGLTLAFDRLSDVTVHFTLFDAQGEPVRFAEVPEPASAALVGVGLALCARARRRS
jgi:hypothetical protein